MAACLRAAIFVGLMFGAISAQAAGRDGALWVQLTESQKLDYAAGFFDGIGYAQGIYGGALLAAMADPKTGKFDAKRAEVAKGVDAFANGKLSRDFRDVTAGQIAAGLDKVYSDYRNARIALGDAMIVVMRSINGASDDSINQLLESKRAAAGGE